MTDSIDPNDPAFERRLRALLTEQAEAVTGPPPGLPALAADGPDIGTTRASRRPWVVAAVAIAAALVLIGGLAAVVDDDPAPQHVVTTQPADPTAGLPEGFDPRTAPTVFQVQGKATPAEVAKRYLGRRLGSLDARPEDIVAGLRFETGAPTGAIVPVTWSRPAGGAGGGAVLVKTGTSGSAVVAATTPGVDLGAVHYEGSVLTGRVTSSGSDVPGAALVDVLPFGEPFATFHHAPPPANATSGYGATAKGGQTFEVDTGETDPIVTVRFAEDGVVRAISEVAFHAPDDASNDPTGLTDEERLQQLRDQPPPAPCAEAAADLVPLLAGSFPGGNGTAPRVRADDDVFAKRAADTPAAAVAQLGEALGVRLEAVTSAAPFDGDVAVGARVGSLAVVVHVWPHDGVWSASGATTPAACWNVGSGNVTPIGDADPRTRLELSTITGARSGRSWYRAEDGVAWTVPLDADDLARRNITVVGEYDTIKQTALVERAADGTVVLVQQVAMG